MTTVTPNFAPTGMVRGKIAVTCSGSALVVMSKSFGVRCNRMSRTQPPTRYASYPARRKPSITNSDALAMLFDFLGEEWPTFHRLRVKQAHRAAVRTLL